MRSTPPRSSSSLDQRRERRRWRSATPDAGQQLGHRERLGEVVVGAQVEGARPCGPRRRRRSARRSGPGVRAEVAAHLEAVDVGQPEVEDDRRRDRLVLDGAASCRWWRRATRSRGPRTRRSTRARAGSSSTTRTARRQPSTDLHDEGGAAAGVGRHRDGTAMGLEIAWQMARPMPLELLPVAAGERLEEPLRTSGDTPAPWSMTSTSTPPSTSPRRRLPTSARRASGGPRSPAGSTAPGRSGCSRARHEREVVGSTVDARFTRSRPGAALARTPRPARPGRRPGGRAGTRPPRSG